MSAWVMVFEHPYFSVTKPDGTYELPELPPGTYTFRAWHEKLGTVDKLVTVGEKRPVILNFDFRAK